MKCTIFKNLKSIFFTLKTLLLLKLSITIMLCYLLLKFYKKRNFYFFIKKIGYKFFSSKSEQMRKNTDNKFYI